MDGLAGLAPLGIGEHQLRLAGTGDLVFGILVHITEGVAGNGDGRLPAADHRADALCHDGRAENRSVQYGPDGAVGGLPHFAQAVLGHPLGIGGDGGAFDGHAVFPGGMGRVHRHLIPGALPLGQAQVIILGFQVNKGREELVLNLLPENAGHFVSVHLHQRRGHSDFFHWRGLLYHVGIIFSNLFYYKAYAPAPQASPTFLSLFRP
ncbi:hypothetical protein SDC9_99075 [bioreactor metagenome]|uniref:Uncharacterized protein n=1 Tax=bioreactor metagenome TaxID=1076179 RepID=A0A645AHA2_9ZZZZ